MPQLSPLNWIMLFSMFWIVVIIISILIWWDSKSMFCMNRSENKNIENKWFWL
uniref:ATP synthetase F0 subunit 8 n=2 Tax=Pomacea TaxID=72702 RepID=A0A411ADM9_9CAEN|nr:ATP synthase F0 subunit 8 [Pomacea bridgesi]YP_009563669.1 ATP synthase F0 subunit 8 [Pomacea diffusa]ART65943.1 ATP synthase F0 subunit 8 [Pomacea bridgesi]QAX27156.1 ATP synthetase F0 subunit 8 [Pomacea diffusa]